jgi:hypothetical protein
MSQSSRAAGREVTIDDPARLTCSTVQVDRRCKARFRAAPKSPVVTTTAWM